MKLYTSYFAKYRGDRGVAISNSSPNGFVGGVIESLAPDWEKVSDYKDGFITWEEFEESYIAKIRGVDIEKFLHEGDVLLCWEGKDKPCHRHTLARVLIAKGHEVSEL